MSAAPIRCGFDHPRSRQALNAPVAPPVQECHYSLVSLLLLSALGERPPLLPMQLSPALAAAEAPAAPAGILLNPGGRGRKRLPTHVIASVIQNLPEAWRERLLLMGGPAEAETLHALTGQIPGTRARSFGSLRELVAALGNARLYVGCDAGPLHVAAAMGVPTIALFTASHPLRYAPLGEDHETILCGPGSRAWAAQPGFPSPCAREGTPSHLLAWDSGLHTEIARRRPRLVCPPADSNAASLATFILDRMDRALTQNTAAGAAPAASGAQRREPAW